MLSSPTPLSTAPVASTEVRYATVALALDVRDATLLEHLAHDLGAQHATLADGSVVAAFGLARWHGDEPRRAARFARAAAFACARVGVATGRVAADATAAALVTVALAAASAPGVSLDDTTAALLRDHRPFTAPTSAPATPDAPFVGRATDLATLAESVELAAASLRPTAVVLLGATGLGRSRTLAEAAARMRPGAARLVAVRCDRERRDAPLAALRDALAAVDPLVADALAPRPEVRDPQVTLDAARAALCAVLCALSADAPVVLVVDDAHWLDPASRALLRAVCDAPDAPALALWITADPDDPSAAELRDLVAATSVRTLAPLSRDAAATLVASLLGRPDAALVERGDGNPLFLEALCRLALTAAPDDAIPPGVEATHRALLDRLGAAERDFVKRASIYGRASWVEGTLSLGAPTSAPVDPLRRRGVLGLRAPSRLPDCTELECRSALLADVARATWPAPERAALHRLAAAWLADRPGATLEEIARHEEQSGDPEGAADTWSRAAAFAAGLGSVALVCAHAARALALTARAEPRWRALVARDTALQLAGDRALQRDGLVLLEALARTDDARAEVHWRWCHHARMVDDPALAARAWQAACAHAPPASRWGAAATMEFALLCADRGRFDEALGHAAAALAAADALDDHWLRARAAHTLAYALLEQGADFARAIALYERAAETYRRTGDHRREAIARLNGGAALALVGRFAEALDAFDEARALALRVGNARTAATSLENRGAVRRILGEHRAADVDLALALAEAQRIGHRRLAEAALIERLYLSLADGSDVAALDVRRDAVAIVAASAQSPVQACSALAALLLADARRARVAADTLAQARATAAALDDQGLLQSELLAAVWAADGRRPSDAAAFGAALARYVDAALDAHERRVRRVGFARRFLVPSALLDPSLPADPSRP